MEVDLSIIIPIFFRGLFILSLIKAYQLTEDEVETIV